ncbi:MAG: Fe-S cluster assembly protein SufD [Paludibacteraceae bacterium]|nr:Fe-S cluster assembly protein SufD [Paludibacteraceae bacterium]
MQIEKQYIDLFLANRQAIDLHSAAVLNERRDEAFRLFCENGFPTTTDERYLYTDASLLFEPDYGLNLSGIEFPVNPYSIFRCGVPGINSHLYFVINDRFYSKPQPNAGALPEGVIACGLREAAERYPDLVRRHYGSVADCGDGAVALNTSFAQDGFFLYVPKGVEIQQTIQLINLMRADVDLLAQSRNLIILEEGAKASLLVCAHTLDSHRFLANRVTEVIVGKGARYEHYKLESTRRDMTNLGHLYVQQQEDSDVLINEVTLQNGVTRNNVQVDLCGERANLNLCGMSINDGKQHTDTSTLVRHLVPNCTTNELYKYVLDEEAVGAFSGLIYVSPGASGTKAVQTNRNICLSHGARMHAKPHLEIYNDDVICNHGATVGQLDADTIFYLRSRGIPEAEAKMLLMFAFVADVEEFIRVPALRDTIKMMIEHRFRGHETHNCTGCSSQEACKPKS